jgi:hypothetical protein
MIFIVCGIGRKEGRKEAWKDERKMKIEGGNH